MPESLVIVHVCAHAEPRTSARYVNLFPDDRGW